MRPLLEKRAGELRSPVVASFTQPLARVLAAASFLADNSTAAWMAHIRKSVTRYLITLDLSATAARADAGKSWPAAQPWFHGCVNKILTYRSPLPTRFAMAQDTAILLLNALLNEKDITSALGWRI